MGTCTGDRNIPLVRVPTMFFFAKTMKNRLTSFKGYNIITECVA